MKKIILTIPFLFVSLMMFAQSGTDQIDSLYASAVRARHNGDYDSARNNMSKVLELAVDNQTIRDQASAFLKEISVFDVNVHKLNIPSYGDFQELTVNSIDKWTCAEVPEWCVIDDMSDNYLRIWCAPNPYPVSRSGLIVLSNGDKEITVEVEQDQGKEKKGRVIFRTSPHNAFLETEGMSGYSSSPMLLGTGEYRISVTKDGYLPKDTVLTLNDVVDTTIMIVDLELQPEFGKIRPIIVDPNGTPWITSDLQNVKFMIGQHQVDIADYANSHSFDSREPVEYYGFYKEGVIPLRPAVYDIEVSASGYETYKGKVQVELGKTQELRIVMKSITGKLTVKPGDKKKNAEGATVYIPDLFIRAKVGETLELVEGSYRIEVYKDGYLWDNPIDRITIEEGKNQVFEVMMTRQVDLRISTEGGGEEIYLNGERLRASQTKLNEGEEYEIEVRKPGHWHFLKTIKVSEKDTLFNFTDLKLEKSGVLNLKSDERNLEVILKRKDDATGAVDDYNYAEGKVLSAAKSVTEFKIPHGKYQVILNRNEIKAAKKSHRLAYKGVINFDDSLETKYLRTWMIPRPGALRILGIEYDLTYKSMVASGKVPTPLRANLLEIPIVKGLSTSLAEGAIVYTYGRTDLPAHLPLDHYTAMMPAISGPLMNYDFRLGGGFCQWGDVSMLLSYTYYLQFERLVEKLSKGYYYGSFDHFEGHDLFFGIELSSRLSFFTGYLRAGIQHLKGNRCYSFWDYLTSGGISTPTTEMIPTKQTSFVVTIGFDLGLRSAKGHNIWRVF